VGVGVGVGVGVAVGAVGAVVLTGRLAAAASAPGMAWMPVIASRLTRTATVAGQGRRLRIAWISTAGTRSDIGQRSDS
jgi:hypothetical protein